MDEQGSGQRSGVCTITNCGSYGRSIAKFGGNSLIYCPKHRKYGQEVVNTFLEDVFNYRKSSLFELAKQELLFGGERILDEENEKKLGSWFSKEIFRKYLKDIGTAGISITIREESYVEGEGEEDSTAGEEDQ